MLSPDIFLPRRRDEAVSPIRSMFRFDLQFCFVFVINRLFITPTAARQQPGPEADARSIHDGPGSASRFSPLRPAP
jgi:hypothetical protein